MASNDKVDKLMEYLNDPTLDELPDDLKGFKYTEGFDEDKLEQELQQHPFFCTELPDPTKPLPPLLEAFQQLKYSETDNTPHELASNHREDGIYHFKLKKYRIASTCFTTAIHHELQDSNVDNVFLAQLYNNRSACSWFLKNYRTCVKDCDEALNLLPSYFKAFKRSVLSLVELEKWDEIEKKCGGWEGGGKEEFSFVCEMRIKARKAKVKVKVEDRKRTIAGKEKKIEMEKVLGVVRSRGIVLGDERFMESEAAVSNDRVVKIGGDGGLVWPVLFLYPQYNQSDFVEGFEEMECFSTHLSEILDGDNRPAWDVDREYDSSSVDIYFLSGKLYRVDPKDSLLDVMKTNGYVLPGNGVPSFFVLAKNNAFCENFIERVEGGGG